LRKTAPIRFEAKTQVFILNDRAQANVDTVISDLNPEQRQAVMTTRGAVLVEAGAGTGKTKVLTSRIARLIANGDAVPERILAVTFTNKAAHEMRERLALLIGEEAAYETCMGSFHAVSLAMLRRHALEAGLKNEDFRVFDDGDQLLAMHAAMENAGLVDLWRKPGSVRRDRSEFWNKQAVYLLDQVQTWKDEGRTIDDVETEFAARTGAPNPALDEAVKVYRAYQSELHRRNAVDFADIILLMVNLFRKSPSIRQHWADRFSYVMVDEFQDTDGVQYEWLKTLAGTHGNIFAVGDLDQCIYEWRNANPEIFSGFADDWTNATVIRLHRNYRSTQPILDVASIVVEKSAKRKSKTRLDSGRSGGAVALMGFDTAAEESQWLADDIAQRVAFGQDPGSIAILFRQAKDMPQVEQALVNTGISYAVVSGTRFHKREEVKDIMAWLAIAGDANDEIALLRASQRPAWGIDDQVFARVMTLVKNGTSAQDALMQTHHFDQWASQQAKQGLAAMAEAIEVLGREAKGVEGGTTPLGVLMRRILEQTGYAAWRRRVGLAEDDLDDVIETLFSQADQFEGSIPEFLQHFALLSEADAPNAEKAVRLSTIHAAKGLEFDVVYTPCIEEGILPNDRSLKHERFIEEERRILHVAWTRAKVTLIPSFARNRRYRPAQYSRFLVDAEILDESHKTAAPVAARNTNRYATTKTIRRVKIEPGRKFGPTA
jgi:DNA helicase-2/ATP-dependent DNA helicase PcrA